MIRGFDCAQPVTQRVLSLAKAAGYSAVGRYYGSPTSSKILHQAEAQLISDNGFYIFTYFERTAGRALLGASAGQDDADLALQMASEVGQPEGSSIIFAVDEDIDIRKDGPAILDYFGAVHEKLSPHYKTGIYGEADAVLAALGHGVAEVDVLAGAAGWDRSRTYRDSGAWKARQYPETKPGGDLGIGYDRVDITHPDALGCWSMADMMAQPDNIPTPEMVVAKARELQSLMKARGDYQGAIDGQIGPKSSAAEMRIFALTRA